MNIYILYWFLGAIFYGYENLLQIAPGAMSHDLMRDFHLDASGLGLLASSYFYAYALLQIPVGLIIDRINVRWILSLSCLACACGTWIFSISHQMEYACIGRFLVGMGSISAFLCTTQMASRYFEKKYFTFSVGALVAIGMSGSIAANQPLVIAIGQMGWRSVMLQLAYIGIALALIMIGFMKTPASPYIQKNQSLKSDLKTVITHPSSWAISLYAAFIYGVVSIFGGLWGVSAMMSIHHVSQVDAAGSMGFLYLGFILGGIAVGPVVQYIKNAYYYMIIGCVFCFLGLLIILYVPMSLFHLKILMGLFGFFCASFFPAFDAMQSVHIASVGGVAMGFLNSLNNLTGAMGQPVVGWLLDIQSHGRIYTAQHYQYALMTLPAMILIALFFLIRSRHIMRSLHD